MSMKSTLLIDAFSTGPFQTNCYVCVNEDLGSAFAVDPGLGAAPAVRELLERRGVELEAVVLTHGHIDHVRDASAFGAPVYIHAADAFMLKEGVPTHSQQLFNAFKLEEPDTVHHLEEGGTIDLAGESFTIRHAPGHSPGSVLIVGSDVVFTGDVLFRGSVGRTDLEYSEPRDMEASLRGCVWELDDALTVLPGHGPVTTVAQERATNPFVLAANAGR